MKIFALLIAFVLSPLARAADAPAVAPAKPLRELLQQGLFEEEANRDLGKAAAAYTELLAQFDSQRAFAATALFRLAEIRAKQGDNAGAITLHQRLLAKFPTHDPLAKLSRERLAALGGPAPALASSEAPTNEEAQELARVREMAKNSPDLINARGDGGVTPLGRAAKAGWLAVASYLLDHGAQVDSAPDYNAPLQTAAGEGHKRMVELLLARGADVQRKIWSGETALWAACAGNRAEVARVLLEAGADPNVPAKTEAYSQPMTPLSLAAAAGNESLAKMLLDHRADPNLTSPEGASPLAFAILDGTMPLARLLLARGAKADAAGPRGTTPLHLAVAKAPAFIEPLLEHGAKIDLADSEGATPLHLAAQAHPDTVPLLLAHGASPNARKIDGSTPLHASVGEYWTHPQHPSPVAPLTTAQADKLHGVWEALLAKGAEINAQDKAGRAPLHYAIARSDFPSESLVWLMEHGADLHLVDNSGVSALGLAEAERWSFFARRDLFPKLTQERAVNLFVNFGKAANEPATKARHIIASTAESDAPPTLADLIRAVFAPREDNSRPRSLWKDFDAVVYRADAAGALTEAARVAMNLGNPTDTSQWPTLHWGDVVVFERLSKGGGGKQNSDTVERWLEKLGFPRRETK